MAVEYTLKHPVTLGEETIKVVKLEEPTQANLEKFDFDYAELSKAVGLRKVVCACATNITEAHVAKMKPVDIAKAGSLCSDFFG